MRFVYFARVREAIGFDCEDRDVPAGIETVADCLAWLAGLGKNYAAAFSDPERLRFALDQQIVHADGPIENAKELAIFPPVTGG